MQYLMFTLYAPMGSLGEIAVGERRMSWVRPSRSAVLGLVAAALGVKRSDETAHRTLQDGLFFAVRTDALGRPFVDYHTAQTPKARKGRSYSTRRDELELGELHTVLSTREWRSDACYTVVLWPRRRLAVDLEDIACALRSPDFVIYLGRKSAPLGLPLNPEIVEADTFTAALAGRSPNEMEEEVLTAIKRGTPCSREIAFDGNAPDAPLEARIERRRDVVISRTRWQFADRLEGTVLAEGDGE